MLNISLAEINFFASIILSSGYAHFYTRLSIEVFYISREQSQMHYRCWGLRLGINKQQCSFNERSLQNPFMEQEQKLQEVRTPKKKAYEYNSNHVLQADAVSSNSFHITEMSGVTPEKGKIKSRGVMGGGGGV